MPFQDGFKYAYVRYQQVAAESGDGKKASAEINALREKLQNQLNDKNKALQGAQAKLEGQGSVLNDTARQQLQADIERQQREIQRAVEDAEQEVERLTQRLQRSFMEKLLPTIDRVAKEKKIDMVFNAEESGLVWAAPGMDLTADVIKALDGGAAAKPAAQATPTSPAPTAAR